MQHDNNIQNKLRQLEAMEQPDMSQVDAHWKQMQAMLQPTASPVKKGWPKWMLNGFYGAAVLVMIIAAVWFLAYNRNSTNDTGSLNSARPDTAKANMAVVYDTTLPDKNEATIHDSNTTGKKTQSIDPSLVLDNTVAGDTVQWTEQDSILGTIKLKVTDCGTCPGKTDSVQLISNAERQLRLQMLFSQVKQEEQHFIIDNMRDTLIAGKEGTVLFIPAMSFNGMDSVTVSLSEYYKYSDMILNRLITKSGDDQLISGGMFHIEANRNGESVHLNRNIPVMVFIPSISAKDSLQIFSGEQQNVYSSSNGSPEKFQEVNWRLSNVSIDSPILKMFVRAIDLRDNLASITIGNKTKAVFTMSRTSAYSKEQLKEMLQKKYGGYYDKIKVHQQWERNIFFKKFHDGYDSEWGDWVGNSWGIGDTAELTPLSMKIYKLQPIDTVYKVLYWLNKGMRKINLPLLTEDMKAVIGEKYNIQINQLGWINCDRFNKTAGPKNNYVIDLKDSSYSYYTVIVFDKYKSIMNGTVVNNTMVAFNNIPASEPFRIISIGVDKSGNTVYAMKEGIFRNSIIDNLQFQTTSAPDLRASLSKLDK